MTKTITLDLFGIYLHSYISIRSKEGEEVFKLWLYRLN